MKYFRNVQNGKYSKFNTTLSSPGHFFTQISLRGAIQTICFCTIDTVRTIRKKWPFPAFFDISFCRESSWGTRLAKITNRNVSQQAKTGRGRMESRLGVNRTQKNRICLPRHGDLGHFSHFRNAKKMGSVAHDEVSGTHGLKRKTWFRLLD